MRVLVASCLAGIVAFLCSAAPVSAALLSKSFKFKAGVTLNVGAGVKGGLRVDTVRFRLPENGRKLLLGRNPRAEVAISNSSAQPLRVSIAIALFDAGGRLVGVASGGSRLLAIKPDRQSTYSLVFDDVNAHAHRAATFQITVEAE